ncbi:hypothetical protein BKA62DRAFT_173564 [Auriculariales sp. MPI-PUGE-AT-0066]|nr:hypothetical protein BKA62DRAFT_173564 [Auriculariales sp. MPI-PUGE-AT-0066]
MEVRPPELPVELFYGILLQGARDFIQHSRASVVQLALVSREAYQLIRPILYDRLIVTKENEKLFTQPEVFDALLAHVRYMHIVDEEVSIDIGHELLQRWNPPPGSTCFLDASLHFTIKYISEHPDTPLNGVRIINMSFSRAVFAGPDGQRLPRAFLRNLTHLAGHLPADLAHMDGEWELEFLAETPALTHLALQVVDYEGFDSFDEVRLFSYGTALITRALLKHSTLKCLCLRMAGTLTCDTTISVFQDLVKELQDMRLKVWFDTRHGEHGNIFSWHDSEQRWNKIELQLEVHDSFAGYDIWMPEERPSTEGQVICYSPSSSVTI